ncbi:MAG: hypothetical protein CSYNP_03100 [Syntrophus sp. SKADARSKE-3]|nr:hypothetical protein [Syntrophus sp. SKADARSKE-3]
MASQKIGALWKRKTQDGKTFLSGVIQDIRGDINVAVFANDRKDKDTQPDFNIVRSEQREQREEAKQEKNDDFNFGNSEPKSGDDEEIKVENIPW